MTSTCLAWATWSSASATCSATSPPIPWSTSSNTTVAMASCPASTTLRASMRRDSSPPLATWASGRASSPGLSCTMNLTASPPDAVTAGAGSTATLNSPSGIPRPGSSRATAWASRPAACLRLAVRAAVACSSSRSAAARRSLSSRRSKSAVSSRSSSRLASVCVWRTSSTLGPYFCVRRYSTSRRRSTSASRSGSASMSAAYSRISRASSSTLA